MNSRVFFTILCMLLVFVWALFKLVLMCSLHLHANIPRIHAQRRLRLTMQHVYGHSGNLGNECADHAAALGTLSLTTLPHAGLVIILTLLYVLMAVTTSARSWNDYSTFEQMRRQGLAMVFLIGSTVSLCTSNELQSCVSLALKFFSLGCCFPNK